MASKTTNLVLGFLAGAATGAVLGILYAPDKGSKTRKKIKEQSEKIGQDVKKTVGEKVEGLQDYVNETIEEIKNRFSKLEKDVKKQEEDKKPKAS